MRRSGRGRPSPMRRAIDQILRFAPSMRPPMLPVVSRTKATSTRGAVAAGAVALVTATRAGEFGRSKGSATGATARNRNGIKTGMVGLQDDYRQAACLFPDLSPTPPNPVAYAVAVATLIRLSL